MDTRFLAALRSIAARLRRHDVAGVTVSLLLLLLATFGPQVGASEHDTSTAVGIGFLGVGLLAAVSFLILLWAVVIDAEEYGRSPLLWGLAVFLTNYIGLVAWLVRRRRWELPSKKAETKR
jgi:protein-S-isoprenylcysteine O-methyltransferase Ste14